MTQNFPSPFGRVIAFISLLIYATPTWSQTGDASSLAQSTLMLRQDVLDFGPTTVGELWDCFSQTPLPAKVISVVGREKGEFSVRRELVYVAVLENTLGHRASLVFEKSGDANRAVLREIQTGPTTVISGWPDIYRF